MKKLKNLAKNNRQHGKVDMLKATRSTVAEPVTLCAMPVCPKTEGGRIMKIKTKNAADTIYQN